MPTTRANLDVTQYVRITTDPIQPSSLLLQSHRDTVRIAFSDIKPSRDNTVFHELGGEHEPWNIPLTETAGWALATSSNCALTVTQGRVPVEVGSRGDIGQSVFINDQITPILSVPMLREINTTSLAVNAVVENKTVTLQPGHGAVPGNMLEVATVDTGVFFQSEIISVNGDVIGLDQPINYPYLTSDIAVISNRDMNVNGSVTPQVFSILPLPSQRGDIVRIIFEIQDDMDMDFTTFGGLAKLINGCVLRINNGDGTFRNVFNFKDNGDIISQSFDHLFLLPKQGGSIRGFTARLTWGGQSKHGVVIRLDGSIGESLELIIQDNLTLLTRFRIIAQGHELQG